MFFLNLLCFLSDHCLYKPKTIKLTSYETTADIYRSLTFTTFQLLYLQRNGLSAR